MEKKRMGRTTFVSALLLLILLATACGSGDNLGDGSQDPKEKPPINAFDPNQTATISFYNNIGVPDSYYDDYILKHIQNKFPNVKVNYLNSSADGNKMTDLVTANQIPDIILTTNSNLLSYMDMNALQPLDPIIKRNNIDTSVFRDDMIKALQGYSSDQELYALPWSYGTYALYYNKEIFDRFAVDYPQDGMTWDDPHLRDMVGRLSRTDGDTQYRGLEFNLGIVGVNPLSLSIVDPVSLKASIDTDAWKSFLNAIHAFYQIGGNEKPKDTTLDGRKSFVEQRTVAMWAGNAIYPILIELEKAGTGFDWDIVSLPTFKEAPNTGVQYSGALYTISSTTKQADLALQIISHLTSAEIQIEGGSLLRYPTLKAAEVQEAFGKGEKFLESKNMKALHRNGIASSPLPTKYDTVMRNLAYEKIHPLMKGTIDINTALRQAEEVINSRLAEEVAKGN